MEVYLHYLLLCGFSPTCVLIMCLLRLLVVVIDVEVCLHTDNGVTFLQCVSKCAFSD